MCGAEDEGSSYLTIGFHGIDDSDNFDKSIL